jgi:hypothetical protein
MTGPFMLHFVARLSAAASPLPQQAPPLDRLLNGVAVLVALFIIAVCIVGFIVVLITLLPRVSERSEIAMRQSPWRAFFIGLANYLFLGGISLLLLSTEIPPLAFSGLVLSAVLVVVTVIGMTGLIRLIGDRLRILSGRDMSDLARLIWAAIVLELAIFLPFIGWFLLAPALSMISFGAAVLGWWHRKRLDSEHLGTEG